MSFPLEDFKLLLTGRNLALFGGGKATGPHQGSAAAAGTQQPEQQQQGDTAAKQPRKPQPPAPLSAAAKAEVERTACGGCVVRLAPADAAALGIAGGDRDDDGGALAANAPLAVCVWRTRASLGVLVTKAECDDMLERISDGEARRAAAAKALAGAVGGAATAREPAVAGA